MSDQRTALVLGGGGITGIAWEIGVLAGLADAGIDLSTADLVVGTSAGSVVGAQLTSGSGLKELYEEQLDPPTDEPVSRLNRATMAQFAWAMLRTRRDSTAFRRRVGTLALTAEKAGLTPPEQERIDVFEAFLGADWPDRKLVVTAVDAETGEFRPFDRDSGVPLVRAVAASCAVPGVYPPVTIDGRRYVDGGMRSAANADLAQGYDRVVVLAPLPRGVGPIASVDAQVTGMISARVAVVAPDAGSKRAIGKNVLDPAARAASAEAGRRQAASLAAQIADVWTG